MTHWEKGNNGKETKWLPLEPQQDLETYLLVPQACLLLPNLGNGREIKREQEHGTDGLAWSLLSAEGAAVSLQSQETINQEAGADLALKSWIWGARGGSLATTGAQGSAPASLMQ